MDVKLEIENEDKSCEGHIVTVNGVRLHIFQHDDGSVTMMIHGAGSDTRISMCDVKVSKKTLWVGNTRWADIEVVE